MAQGRREARMPAGSIFERDLERRPANFRPLTPLTFLDRAADTFPDRVAVRHGALACSYAELRARCLRLAAGLAARGVEPDRKSVV